MKIKDCVIKILNEEIWLHHTHSGYRVKINREALGVIESMLSKNSAADLTVDEKFVFEKLSAQGIVGEGSAAENEKNLTILKKSGLESVEIELSGFCNLRCSHCYSSLSQVNMSAETIAKLFEGFDGLEPVTLTVSGGEPLMNSEFTKVLGMARERRMRVNVMSNATLVTPEIARSMKALGVARTYVSLDFFESTHDSIRGAGSFKKAVDGINALTAHGVPVFVTAMVLEGNIREIDEFKEFCIEKLRASGIRFSSITSVGRALENPGLVLDPRSVHALHGAGHLSAIDDAEELAARPSGRGSFNCNAGTGQCFVSADGMVYPCHYFQNIGEPMGDLKLEPLGSIFSRFAESGSIAVDLDWNKLESCVKCGFFSKCRGGCRARARIVSGSWHSPDEYSCHIYGHDPAQAAGNK